jgi:hypothetical protein
MEGVNPWEFFPGPQYDCTSFAMDTNSCGIQRLMVATNLSHFNNLKDIYVRKIINYISKAREMHTTAITEVLST